MTPLPDKPQVVIRINPSTLNVVDVASNIGPVPQFEVVVVTTATEYEAEAAGKPFDTLRDAMASIQFVS